MHFNNKSSELVCSDSYLLQSAGDDDQVSASLHAVLPAGVPAPPLSGDEVTAGAEHQPALWTAVCLQLRLI